MPLIVNTTNSMRGLPMLGKAGEKQVVLLPGANEVDDKYWAEITTQTDGSERENYVLALVDQGILIVREMPKATKDWAPGARLPSALGELKEKAALVAIEACKNGDQLEAWLSTDSRPKVREALTRRAYAIAPAAGAEAGV